MLTNRIQNFQSLVLLDPLVALLLLVKGAGEILKGPIVVGLLILGELIYVTHQ